MKQRKLLGTLAIALTLVLTACGGGGNGGGSSKKATHKHEYGDWQTVTAATCTQGGTEKRVCKNSDGLCTKVEDTRSTSALGHQEPSPLVKEDEVAATCETAGSYKYTCARCGQKVEVEVPALQHEWVDAEDQSGAIAPTCTEAGTKIQVCTHDASHKRSVVVPAEGHDFPEQGTELEIPGEGEKNTKGEVPFKWAKITNFSCTKGDSYRYAWDAKEVNFDYEHEGVHFTQEEIDAAGEDDPAYGKTTADWKSEPNLIDEGDGIRFWGRPIGNAVPLDNQGKGTSSSPKVPDESVKGSRFEFDFVFDADVNDVCLSAELTPAQYTNDIFKNRPNDQEWTPGYRFIDDDNDPSTPKVEQMIETFRYIIYLDGVEVPLDASVSTAPAGKGWYQFPCKLNLTAGKHNLNIAMAGGYLHTFYRFSFEKVAPAHEHKYGAGTAQTDEALSNIATCLSEDATRILWDAKKYNAEASQVGTPAASNGGSNGITFGGDGYNKTKNADPNVGDHAVYNVNVPAAQTKAKLGFTINRKDATAVFSAQSGDQKPSYTIGDDGKTTSTKYGWRYKLLVNDVEVEFTPYTTDNPEPKTTANVEGTFMFPCEFALKEGVNKIELQKWGGYTPVIVSLQLVY